MQEPPAVRRTGVLMENLRNQNGIKEKEVLVVSFGTTFRETREKTIGAIEKTAEKMFPDASVRRCFTSSIVVKRLRERDGLAIDSPEEALRRAAENGVRELIVQPTHLMDGKEYHKLLGMLREYKDRFERVTVGAPLLTSRADMERIAEAVKSHLPADTETAVLLMGHGTDAPSNAVYGVMQEILRESGAENYYIATVEGKPVLEDILPEIKERGYRRAILAPFMIVAGDHANNDLAGEEEDSWKSILEKEGFETEASLHGIGEWEEIRELFAEHALQAVTEPV